MRAIDVLSLVDMERDVIGYGLASTADPHAASRDSRPRRSRRGRKCASACSARISRAFVELFDRGKYSSNMSVAENLLFGTPRRPDFQLAEPRAAIRRSSRCCARSACSTTCTRPASKVAALMVEIFADVAPDSDLFEQYSFISPEDLPEFQVLVSKFDKGKLAAMSDHDKARLLALTFRLVASRHRLGVIDDGWGWRRASSRRAQAFSRRYNGRDDICEFFQPDRFSAALSIQDNILFGRIAFDQANAQTRISTMVRDIAAEEGLNPDLARLGLEFDVGNGGSRLSYSERQRLAIARGLIKNADVLVFNEPTSGLDPATETRVLMAVLNWAKGRTVLWALSRAELAREFDRVLVFADGHLVEEGKFEELEHAGNALTQLVA